MLIFPPTTNRRTVIKHCSLDGANNRILDKDGRVYNINFPLDMGNCHDILEYVMPLGFNNTAYIQAKSQSDDSITFLLDHIILDGDYIKT